MQESAKALEMISKRLTESSTENEALALELGGWHKVAREIEAKSARAEAKVADLKAEIRMWGRTVQDLREDRIMFYSRAVESKRKLAEVYNELKGTQ